MVTLCDVTCDSLYCTNLFSPPHCVCVCVCACVCTCVCVRAVLGLLPYIDNYSQIGGFLCGILSSFIFVPYITLGKWDKAKKLCLILVTLPLILTFFLMGFVLFYNLPDPDFCPKCSYINCVPITSNFCDDFITNIVSEIIPTAPPP